MFCNLLWICLICANFQITSSCLQFRQSKTQAPELVAVVEKVDLAVALENMWVALHVAIPFA